MRVGRYMTIRHDLYCKVDRVLTIVLLILLWPIVIPLMIVEWISDNVLTVVGEKLRDVDWKIKVAIFKWLMKRNNVPIEEDEED